VIGISKIKAGGHVYSVEYVDVVEPFMQRIGQVNLLTHEIRIHKDMAISKQEEVLLHELVHIICDLCKFDMSEEDTGRFGVVLHQIWKDNPDLFSREELPE